MLLQITQRCSKECSHCFISATKGGEEMSMRTVSDTVKFLKQIDPLAILISGGEPTEHTYFREVVHLISLSLPGTIISILSNGSFISDYKKQEYVKAMLQLRNVVALQVRTHSKYYPDYEFTMSCKKDIEAISPKIKVFDDGIENLIPLGRSENTENKVSRPPCTNILLLAAQLKYQKGLLPFFIETLHNKGVFCKPVIDIHGNILIGETQYCYNVGSVKDEPDKIMQNIKKATFCNKCGLKDNLRELEKLIINRSKNL